MNQNASGEICLLNDSFPPLIDGVANVVTNYARVLHSCGTDVSVVVPDCPGADDSQFDYSVIRYPSLDLRKQFGYTAGNPFSIPTLLELKKRNIRLLHSHCPFMSNLVARELRASMDIPMVMTYHTKFDVDIANAVRGKLLQESVIHTLVESVSACDELWVVSKGAGENIRSLGYEGDYIVMKNGVDIPRKTATDEEILSATQGYDLPAGVPVFLFVGRLMWYKGIRTILNALSALRTQNLNFRMVFVGGGGDEKAIHEYVEQLNLGNRCFFTGAIRDRSRLLAWYSRADLFLFPSTFDTNGLVVREAAAASLGTVLVRGSCAAEGVTDGLDGLLIGEDLAEEEENARCLAVCLARIIDRPDVMRAIGEKASENLYLSWDEAIKTAADRYEVVIDNYYSSQTRKKWNLTNEFINMHNDLMETYEKIQESIVSRFDHWAEKGMK